VDCLDRRLVTHSSLGGLPTGGEIALTDNEEVSAPGSKALNELVELARRGPVVLLFGARNPEFNQAAVLLKIVEERLGS